MTLLKGHSTPRTQRQGLQEGAVPSPRLRGGGNSGAGIWVSLWGAGEAELAQTSSGFEAIACQTISPNSLHSREAPGGWKEIWATPGSGGTSCVCVCVCATWWGQGMSHLRRHFQPSLTSPVLCDSKQTPVFSEPSDDTEGPRPTAPPHTQLQDLDHTGRGGWSVDSGN